MPAVRVLVADDEPAMREALRRALSLSGCSVELAVDGVDALDRIRIGQPDVVILDVLMPRCDGFEVCRRMRGARDETPVLMLSARDHVADIVAGLDAGADDYLTKPFQLVELNARVRALVRRTTGAGKQLRFDDLEVDLATQRARRGRRDIALTRTEFALLEMFLRHPRRVLARSAVFREVWGYDFGPRSNSLDVYMGYLRRKLESGGEPRVLHTVRGVGYVLRSA